MSRKEYKIITIAIDKGLYIVAPQLSFGKFLNMVWHLPSTSSYYCIYNMRGYLLISKLSAT
ncbi:MAG: hypothetical protein ACI90V_000091 [Bacillariaceae sp.]|jgi:hypothetical protein